MCKHHSCQISYIRTTSIVASITSIKLKWRCYVKHTLNLTILFFYEMKFDVCKKTLFMLHTPIFKSSIACTIKSSTIPSQWQLILQWRQIAWLYSLLFFFCFSLPLWKNFFRFVFIDSYTMCLSELVCSSRKIKLILNGSAKFFVFVKLKEKPLITTSAWSSHGEKIDTKKRINVSENFPAMKFK